MQNPENTTSRRPVGLAILAGLNLAVAVLCCLVAAGSSQEFRQEINKSFWEFMLFPLGDPLGVDIPDSVVDRFERHQWRVWFLMFSLVVVALGVGLWKTHNWARRASLIVSSLGLPHSLLAIPATIESGEFISGHYSMSAVLFLIVLAGYFGGSLWYLLRPGVRLVLMPNEPLLSGRRRFVKAAVLLGAGPFILLCKVVFMLALPPIPPFGGGVH